jgi:hypothetical protein
VRTRMSGVVVAALIVVAGALTMTTAAASDHPAWVIAPPVPTPPGATSSVLRDVTMISPSDVWTVGSYWDTEERPLAVHWDGAKWTVGMLPKPEPLPSPETYSLAGVDATSSADVWAVGSAWSPGPTPLVTSALALHFDGVSWSEAPTPPTSGPSLLTDVDMRTVSDGWAVGQTSGGQGLRPLILRWQAEAWVPVPAPKILPAGYLTSVAAIGPDDAWAVGIRVLAGSARSAFALHWDGTAWTEVGLPAVSGNTSLDSVAATGPSNVWAAGSACTSESTTSCAPLVLRLSGGVWQRIPAAVTTARLTEVVPFGPDDVWVIGEGTTPTGSAIEHAERWDGQQFTVDGSVVVSPQGQLGTALALAAAAGDPASGALWAVGWVDLPVRQPTVIHRY